ncbi:MAG: sodium:calcium antiporter [Deltaproteobacteria bacterium]|nr:sodium:calcium antiporter [Deltaproteobacteria bacterium]
MIWILLFIIAATAVLISGRRLTLDGDHLAETTGLSRGFIGVILLGLVTSLPEMASSVSAALFLKSPDLAIGNIFGSNAANLAILAVISLFFAGPLQAEHQLDEENLLTAYLSLIMLSLALMGLGARGYWRIFHLDLFSLLIAATYVVGLKKLHTFQRPRNHPRAGEKAEFKPVPSSLKKSLLINAAIIVVASTSLATSAEHIAEITGWGSTFVGNSLLAGATSLPEFVVTVSAVGIGSFSMAAGNIFGSNIFNLAILALADLSFFPGSLLAAGAPSQALIAAIGLLLTSMFLFSARYSSIEKIAGQRSRFTSLPTLLIYLFSLYALFALR